MANPSPIGSDHTRVPVRSQTTKPSYLATAIDTQRTARASIISHIEGSPWPVTWYEPILGRDQATVGQQQGASPIHQQYHVIYNLELRVQRDLNHSQDQQSGESNVVGSSIVYPFIVPNKGGIFTAALWDGSIGIFELTSVERLAVTRETCHAIEYILVGTDADKERVQDLLSKVDKESYFVKDFLYHGQNPVLVKSDYDDLQVIQRKYVTTCRSYVEKTYSNEYATLLVPNQLEPTFDRFLTQAVHRHIDHRLSDRLKYVRMHNVEDDPVMFSKSLWDVIQWQDRELLHECFTKAGLSNARDFTKSPIFESIRYSGIKQLVYPADAPDRVDSESWGSKKVVMPITGLDTSVKSRQWDALRTKLAAATNVPEDEITEEQMYQAVGIKPVHQDGYYIFSEAFYEKTGGQSKLEVLTNQLIDNQPINFSDVRWLIDQQKYWSPVEVYFYCPVLIILMKAVIRSI